MYRCAVLLKNKELLTKNLESKDLCESWILELMEKYDLKKSIIVNKNNTTERYTETF